MLKTVRLRRQGLPRSQRRPFAAGIAASFISTLASQALIRLVERDRALWPYAAYRAALAAVVLTKLRQGRPRPEAGPSLAKLDRDAGRSNGHPLAAKSKRMG